MGKREVEGEVGTSVEAGIQKDEVPFEGRHPRGHMDVGRGTARWRAIGRLWEVVRPSRRAARVGRAFSASAGQGPSSGLLRCMR